MAALITHVAMVGGGGHVGLPITSLLLESGFTVSALLSADFDESTALPESVHQQVTDFSHLSLVSCLVGAQALVAVDLDVETKHKIVVAAIEAKVTRFITGQLGSLAHEPWQRDLKMFNEHWVFREQLRELCDADTNTGLTWTVVEHGPFPLYGIGMIRSKLHKIVTLVDGGNENYAITSYDDLARAVVGILRHLEETKNRAVQILTGYVTPNKVLEALSSEASVEWTIRHVSAEQQLREADEELKEDKPAANIWVANQSRVAFGSKLLGRSHEGKDNQLLGIQKLSDEETLKYALDSKWTWKKK